MYIYIYIYNSYIFIYIHIFIHPQVLYSTYLYMQIHPSRRESGGGFNLDLRQYSHLGLDANVRPSSQGGKSDEDSENKRIPWSLAGRYPKRRLMVFKGTHCSINCAKTPFPLIF